MGVRTVILLHGHWFALSLLLLFCCQDLLADIVDCISWRNISVRISCAVQLLCSHSISFTFAVNDNYVKFASLVYIFSDEPLTLKRVQSTTWNWKNERSRPHQMKLCTWSAVSSVLINNNMGYLNVWYWCICLSHFEWWHLVTVQEWLCCSNRWNHLRYDCNSNFKKIHLKKGSLLWLL